MSHSLSRSLVCLLVLFSLSIGMQSCMVHTKAKPAATGPSHVPPGQAKKASGSQSAKQYAPGQQKKKN